MAKTHSVVSRRSEQLPVPRFFLGRAKCKSFRQDSSISVRLSVLALGWILLALPTRWFRRIIQVAVGARSRGSC